MAKKKKKKKKLLKIRQKSLDLNQKEIEKLEIGFLKKFK